MIVWLPSANSKTFYVKEQLDVLQHFFVLYMDTDRAKSTLDILDQSSILLDTAL